MPCSSECDENSEVRGYDGNLTLRCRHSRHTALVVAVALNLCAGALSMKSRLILMLCLIIVDQSSIPVLLSVSSSQASKELLHDSNKPT